MYMHPRRQLKCYTDSQVVLYWIKVVESEWKLFIQNRVTKIRQLTLQFVGLTSQEHRTLLIYHPEAYPSWNCQ